MKIYLTDIVPCEAEKVKKTGQFKPCINLDKDIKDRTRGMKPQALNDVLNERRKIEATEYFNVCKALNVGLDYFANKMEQVNKKASA